MNNSNYLTSSWSVLMYFNNLLCSELTQVGAPTTDIPSLSLSHTCMYVSHTHMCTCNEGAYFSSSLEQFMCPLSWDLSLETSRMSDICWGILPSCLCWLAWLVRFPYNRMDFLRARVIFYSLWAPSTVLETSQELSKMFKKNKLKK